MPKPRKRKKKTDPEAEARLRSVETALNEAGVALRYDRRLHGRGGLCCVEGDYRVILNGALSPVEKADGILDALHELSPEEG